MRENFSKYKQSNVNNVQFWKATIYIITLFFHFSYLYLSLAGNIIVYTPNQVANREKYFNHIIYQGKDADSGGK